MKKTYQTPYFEVENFLPNDTVTTCSDSTKPVEVDCVISGSEYIFYGYCAQLGYDNLDTATTATCGGKTYVIWPKSNGSRSGSDYNPYNGYNGRPYNFADIFSDIFSDYGGNKGNNNNNNNNQQSSNSCGTGMTLLNKLVSSAGLSGEGGNYHAGPVTTSIAKAINAS